MADTDWVSAGNRDSDRYHDAYDKDNPPEQDFERVREESTTVDFPQENTKRIYSYVVYSRVTILPPPVEVYEYCDRCFGHRHRVRGPVPAADQQHCLPNHFGDHFGLLYTNATVKGREIRRVEITDIRNGIRGLPLVQWETRTISHTEDGLQWASAISNTPCFREGEVIAFAEGSSVSEQISLAVRELEGLGSEAAIALHTFTPLLREGLKLDRPKVSLIQAGAQSKLVLSDGSPEGTGEIQMEIILQWSEETGLISGTSWRQLTGG